MAKGFKGKKKGKWDDLPEEFRESIAGAKDEKINEEIRNAALYEEKLAELEKEDQDLATAKERAKEAGRVYREGKKACRLKIAFCRETLKNRGRALPGDDVVEAAKKKVAEHEQSVRTRADVVTSMEKAFRDAGVKVTRDGDNGVVVEVSKP